MNIVQSMTDISVLDSVQNPGTTNAPKSVKEFSAQRIVYCTAIAITFFFCLYGLFERSPFF